MRKIPEKIRQEVLHRDKRCRHCGRLSEFYHIHHLYGRLILPPYWTGIKKTDHPHNLVVLCPQCHHRVHASHPNEVTYWKEWRERIITENIEAERPLFSSGS